MRVLIESIKLVFTNRYRLPQLSNGIWKCKLLQLIFDTKWIYIVSNLRILWKKVSVFVKTLNVFPKINKLNTFFVLKCERKSGNCFDQPKRSNFLKLKESCVERKEKRLKYETRKVIKKSKKPWDRKANQNDNQLIFSFGPAQKDKLNEYDILSSPYLHSNKAI